MSGKLTDKFLIASCLAGDEEAFGKLYDAYVDEIYRFISMRLRSREEAEDLTSETFLKAWQYIAQKQKQVDNFRALLYRIARNLVIDHYRKSGKEFLQFEEGQLDKIPDERLSLADSVAHDDDIRTVMSVMDAVSHDARELLHMRYIQDLSISEIADVLGKKRGTIRVALHRAVKDVKQLLKNKHTRK